MTDREYTSLRPWSLMKLLIFVVMVPTLLIVFTFPLFISDPHVVLGLAVGWMILGFALAAGMVRIVTRSNADPDSPWLDNLADWFADWAGSKGWSIFSTFRYRKRYLQHLERLHWRSDESGLLTRGIFTLSLEDLYIDLYLSPESIYRITTAPIRSSALREPRKGRSIWHYLNSTEVAERNLAIIAPPGQGKTTLLKHMALTLAGNRQRREKVNAPDLLPILLFLRDYGETISTHPDLKLSDLLADYISQWGPLIPPSWFEAQLERGTCIIMLDGLDEIGEGRTRRQVAEWIQRLMVTYRENCFVVTSRRHGYVSDPLPMIVLEVQPFSLDQVAHFINNWYVINDVTSARRNDPVILKQAKDQAQKLLTQIRNTPALADMAVNPLLLTMMANVHKYRGKLPNRRVDLYDEIYDVLLDKRQVAKGLDVDLIASQQRSVLQHLAYHMMFRHLRRIKATDAWQAIERQLERVNPEISPQEFLAMVENNSGLLTQPERGWHSFAHLTLQEYLAAVHIKSYQSSVLRNELIHSLGDDWWHETTRLYCAQADATEVVKACMSSILKGERPSLPMLVLGMECLREAQEVAPGLERNLNMAISLWIEDTDAEQQGVIAEALLTLRLRQMLRVDEGKHIDISLLTHAEYQLFLNDQRIQGQLRWPDHWLDPQFPTGKGNDPVTGVRPSDADAFCAWLTEREIGPWRYRLPHAHEIRDANGAPLFPDTRFKAGVGYWITQDEKAISFEERTPRASITHAQLSERILRDRRMLQDATQLERTQFRNFVDLLARALGIKPDHARILVRRLRASADIPIQPELSAPFNEASDKVHALNFDRELSHSLYTESVLTHLLSQALEKARYACEQFRETLSQAETIDAELARTHNLAQVHESERGLWQSLEQALNTHQHVDLHHTLDLLNLLDKASSDASQLERALREAQMRITDLGNIERFSDRPKRVREIAGGLGLDTQRAEIMGNELGHAPQRTRLLSKSYAHAVEQAGALHRVVEDAHRHAIIKTLILTLVHARERALERSKMGDGTPEIKALASFLRWCIRYCAFVLLTSFLNSPSPIAHNGSLTHQIEQQHLRNTLMEEYIHFAALEERIGRQQSACEGIRIVKERKYESLM